MLEYHPEPLNQWFTIGNIQFERFSHAVLSIGFHQLPCLSASGDTMMIVTHLILTDVVHQCNEIYILKPMILLINIR